MKFNFKKFYSNYKEYIVLAVLLFLSLLILPLNNHPSVKKIKSYGFASFAIFNSAVYNLATIFEDNEELQKQKKINAELMMENNSLRKYALENHDLKDLLSIKETSAFPLISASIISKLVSKSQGNYIINTGSADSVKVGMPVINEKGFVGLVIDVSQNFSLVRTIRNSYLKIAVRIQRLNLDGILSWEGGKLVVNNLPATSDIKIGDRIVTSDFSTVVPPSIPVGIVSELVPSYSGALTNLTVQPFVDIERLEHLFIVKVVTSKQIDNFELNLFN